LQGPIIDTVVAFVIYAKSWARSNQPGFQQLEATRLTRNPLGLAAYIWTLFIGNEDNGFFIVGCII
jgi:hypothetical protein